MMRFSVSLTAIAAFFFSLSVQAVLPEKPIIDSSKRPVHGIERDPATNKGNFVRPYMPSLRTSLDGRIAMTLREVGRISNPGYPESLGSGVQPYQIRSLRIYLIKPEAMTNYIVDSGPGLIPALKKGTNADYVDIPIAYFYDPDGSRAKSNSGQLANMGSAAAELEISQPFLCDQGKHPGEPGGKVTHYQCDVNGNSSGTGYDCYDLQVMVPTKEIDTFVGTGSAENPQKITQRYVRLWRSSITVIVANPKTPSAAIAGIYPTSKVAQSDMGDYRIDGDHQDLSNFVRTEGIDNVERMRGELITQFQNTNERFVAGNFAEPMFTSDGKLLVVRSDLIGNKVPALDLPKYRSDEIATTLSSGDVVVYVTRITGNGIFWHHYKYQGSPGQNVNLSQVFFEGNTDWVDLNDANPGYVASDYMHPLFERTVRGTYAVTSSACDIAGFSKRQIGLSGFSDLKPLTYAVNDPDLHHLDGSPRYGFAKHAFYAAGVSGSSDISVRVNLETPKKTETGDVDAAQVADLQVAFPWIDREGRNIFFSAIDQNVNGYDSMAQSALCHFDTSVSADSGSSDNPPYTHAATWCKSGGNFFGDRNDTQTGIGVAGLWTGGKLVLLDGLLNENDFGLKSTDVWLTRYKDKPTGTEGQSVNDSKGGHLWLPLYGNTGCTGAQQDSAACISGGWVRVGSGRDGNDDLDTGNYSSCPADDNCTPANLNDSYLNFPGYVFYVNLIDSAENLYNYNEYMKPVTPRDVVWRVNTGRGSDEVAFDDFVDPNVLIYSNMMPALAAREPFNLNYGRKAVAVADGIFDKATSIGDWNGKYIQNSSHRADAPVAGVPSSGVRVESVALGGIYGRGLWLEGGASSKLTYTMANISDVKKWYVGLYVDNRASLPDAVTLLSFPDGSSIKVTPGASGQVRYYKNGSNTPDHSIAIDAGSSTDKKWRHLGFKVDTSDADPNNHTVDFYLNGYLKDRYEATGMFSVSVAGDLVVGSGFRGWIDEFKVIVNEEINPEIACNHANGTLIGVDGIGGARNAAAPGGTTWGSIADSYLPIYLPVADDTLDPHASISAILSSHGKKTYPKYACYHDYTGDYKAHLGNVPLASDGKSASIRDVLLMPESPLYHDKPRPEFSQNPFCLSCHVGVMPNDPLSLHALKSGVGNADQDIRRQPMQPPARIYGVGPLWTNPSLKGTDKSYVDHWLLPKFSDGDHDQDGVLNSSDVDNDNDDHLDGVDNCPLQMNADQLDNDSDGIGDACDWDDDNDKMFDAYEVLLGSDPYNNDSDGDNNLNGADNCLLVENPKQFDLDADGYGNACDGDVAGQDGVINLEDIRLLVNEYGSWIMNGVPGATLPYINSQDSEVKHSDLILWARDAAYQPGPSGLACAGSIPCEAN